MHDLSIKHTIDHDYGFIYCGLYTTNAFYLGCLYRLFKYDNKLTTYNT